MGTLNILLAEDNRVNLFITESMLNDWGFNVDVAEDGAEVIRMMELKDYDMVLMDIQMPIMDGLEATKKIREMRDPKKSKVPVIALTANTGRHAHQQFMTFGMNDWVVKPFKEETLYRKMARHLRGNDLLSETMKKRKFPTRKKPVVFYDDLLYDLSALKNDQPSNRLFLIKMLTIFVDTIPVSVEKMFHHFEKNELEEVSKKAHKIKPSIDSAGIVLLRECIRNIEEYKEKKRNLAQMKSDLTLLRKVIAEVVEGFNKEIEKLRAEEN
ncbi:MAG: response regulator [Bacteroidetes bacterium]|nr:response regulator [Bacteroidota bacterium]